MFAPVATQRDSVDWQIDRPSRDSRLFGWIFGDKAFRLQCVSTRLPTRLPKTMPHKGCVPASPRLNEGIGRRRRRSPAPIATILPIVSSGTFSRVQPRGRIGLTTRRFVARANPARGRKSLAHDLSDRQAIRIKRKVGHCTLNARIDRNSF